MTIPVSVVWEIALVLLGFIFGTLWGHHSSIGKRVTYQDCAEKQRNCPCVQHIQEIKNNIETLHPHQK
jgi:hypothetical protein